MFDVLYWVKDNSDSATTYSRLFNKEKNTLLHGNAATVFYNKLLNNYVCIVTTKQSTDYRLIIKNTECFTNPHQALTYADVRLSEFFNIEEPLNLSIIYDDNISPTNK